MIGALFASDRGPPGPHARKRLGTPVLSAHRMQLRHLAGIPSLCDTQWAMSIPGTSAEEGIDTAHTNGGAL